MIELRAMTDVEFEAFLRDGEEGFAQQRSRNFGTSLEYERAQAERQYAELLPTGADTKDYHFWTITQTGAPVGFLWVRVDEAARHAFLFEIAVHPDHRGRGYSGRALDLLEEDIKRMVFPAWVSTCLPTTTSRSACTRNTVTLRPTSTCGRTSDRGFERQVYLLANPRCCDLDPM